MASTRKHLTDKQIEHATGGRCDYYIPQEPEQEWEAYGKTDVYCPRCDNNRNILYKDRLFYNSYKCGKCGEEFSSGTTGGGGSNNDW